MCGICGYADADTTFSLPEPTLVAMRDSMRHRGPDDAGVFCRPGAGLASRRLAILDLSAAGHMPMLSASGRLVGVYNGEVYNYRELRQELEQSGHRCRSNSDTEVVLELFERHGPSVLGRFNGMFAIAIWNVETRDLFLARDRLGIKPLYYTLRDGRLLFASEEKALFAAGFAREFDPATWAELLCFRYVAGDRTPYRGVSRLLPGHYMLWRDGHTRIVRWWNLGERAVEHPRDAGERPEPWFLDTFDTSVAYRRISDVPLGVLLSGGLDSSAVATTLARQAGRGVASFTMSFPDAGYDEGPLARQVATASEMDHHELAIRQDDLLGRLTRASWLNDEPLVHGNEVHILAIAEYAKPLVTVLLSGEGGDEVFGGYVRYRPLAYPRLLSSLHRPLAASERLFRNVVPRLGKLARFARLGRLRNMVLFNACDTLPADLLEIGFSVPDHAFEFRERVLEEAERVHPDEPIRQAMYSDLHTFLCSVLDRNDRMTMGASIECRVPFLDYRLVEGAVALPTRALLSARSGKRVVREAMASRVPAAVLRHRKWGFDAPWAHYLRTTPALRDLVTTLPDREPFASGPFDRNALRATLARFLSGDDAKQMLVRQMAMVDVWYSAVSG